MRKKLSRVLMILGILLAVSAVVLFLGSHWMAGRNATLARETAEKMLELMPPVADGAPDGRLNVEMTVLELGGEDFCAVLEIPAYDVLLPVSNAWDGGSVGEYPRRYAGSVHDSTLVVGGSDAKGQLACVEMLSIGDTLSIIDTAGVRYTYTVKWVEKTSDVSRENLCKDEYALTLFARNTYGGEYTLIRCE